MDRAQALRTFLDALPLDALEQTLGIDATITPSDLPPLAADVSGVSGSSAPISVSGEVNLSQVSAVAASWISELPALEIRGEGRKVDLEMQEALGEGGMGVVRSAKQCALGRQVAVKMLHADAQGADKTQALLREALVMGQLEHPNIIPVYTLGQNDGKPLLVMKRVEGVSWRALIHDPEHPHWSNVDAHGDPLGFHLQVLIQVTRALEFSHSRGIIHRDIKPDNVMIGSYGEVYLLDWGIALHLDERATQRPSLLGTPAYMAPEMAMGMIGAIDARTDVYLLGATLYEILTKRTRHQGPSLMATLCAAGASAPVVFEREQHVPAELGRIVNQATAAEAGARYQDAGAFREAVSKFLHHRGSLALSEEASAQAIKLFGMLDAFKPEDAQEVQRLFAAIQFGFLMALRAWSENEDARAGLSACVERMARFEMGRGDVEHAARLLEGWSEGIDGGFCREVMEALQAHRQNRSQLDVLVKMREDLDLNQGHQRRSQFLVGMGVVSMVVTVVVMVTTPHDSQLSWGQMLGLDLTMSAIYFGGLWLGRDKLMMSLINRRFAAVMGMFPIGIGLQRLMMWHYGSGFTQAFAQDMLLGALMCVVAAITVYKRLAWGALSFGLGSVGALLMPGWGAVMFGISSGVVILIFIWVLGSTRRGPTRRDGDETPSANPATAR